ncbi:hypothetical protein Tco_0963280 [Tanacetum coccineum]
MLTTARSNSSNKAGKQLTAWRTKPQRQQNNRYSQGGRPVHLESSKPVEEIRIGERRAVIVDQERGMGMNMHRSGSAPPTVEGSLNAVGGLYRSNDLDHVDNGK